MNQNSHQKAKNSEIKDFYKLLSNSNFGCNCRNNIDNCSLMPINDELDISYLKRYESVFDKQTSEFVNCDLIEQEIENEFNQNLLRLKFDKHYDSRANSLKIRRAKQLDAVRSMRQHKQKTKVKMTMKPYENRITDAEKIQKLRC